MTTPKHSGLIDWYLARLRSRRLKNMHLTPSVLLKSDAELIGEIVNQVGQSSEVIAEKQFARLSKSLDLLLKVQITIVVVLLLGIAGCIMKLLAK